MFLHGAGAGPGDPPADRLRDALGDGYRFAAPDLGEPDAGRWLDGIGRALEGFPDDGIVVGHSLGGSTFLKFVAERHPGLRAAGFVGIAMPFWGEPDWEVDDFRLPDGFAASLGGLRRICLHQSGDDDVVAFTHLAVYGRHIPRAELRQAEAGGHVFETGDIGAILADIRAM